VTAPWSRILIDAHLASFSPEMSRAPYGAVEDGALGIDGEGRIAFAGPGDGLPGAPEELAREVVSLRGAWVTPGLVDCHTHVVFGGSRVAEFERRLEGASYREVAAAGGGILSTVRATRAASTDALVDASRPRLDRLLAEGVTTVEIKSGYGLETEAELRMLRAARRLGEVCPVEVRTTFLGAHALPPERRDDRAGYVEMVCQEMLPAASREGLVDAVDAFLESIAFDREEVTAVFAAARALGVPVKLHADQLSDGGGAELAAAHGALSADHLEYTSPDGVAALARAGTVAVLLPGAFLVLRETQQPPVPGLRDHRVPIALATDVNPGSSPLLSPLLTMALGCTLFRLTPEEALGGMTREGARALGLLDDRGTLDVGKRADLAVWDVGSPAELAYWMGAAPLRARYLAGEPV